MSKAHADKSASRTWHHKFQCAIGGVGIGIRGHSSFSFHFVAAFAVVGFAFLSGCNLLEWAVLILCIGGVMVAELINSAIETLVRAYPDSERARFWPALDIAAGAVLVAASFALIVGLLVLGPRLLDLAFRPNLLG